MDQILEGLEGVVSIADDIVVHGATEEQHDDNMRILMERTRENVLLLTQISVHSKLIQSCSLDVCMTRMVCDQIQLKWKPYR